MLLDYILKDNYSFVFLTLWLLSLLHINKNVDKSVRKAFYLLIIHSLLLFILCFTTNCLIKIPGTRRWCSLVASLKYVLRPSLLCGVLMISERNKTQKERCIMRIPLWIFLIIMAVSYPFGGVVYHSAPDNGFRPGPLFHSTWIVLLIYMGLIFRSAILSHSSRKECFALLLGEGFIALNIVCERLFDLSIPGMELTVIILAILIYYEDFCFHSESEYRVKKEEELSFARTQAMISQIKPHFIYNSLACIAELCHDNCPEGEESILTFSSYLRNCFQSLTEDGLIPFSQELATIKHYIELEMLQSPDKLSVIYDIQEQHFQVPILSIETLVENAVKHGIRKKHGPGTVTLFTFRDDKGIHILIRDDGVGFDVEKQLPDGNHLGLKNARMRLEEQCHAQMSVTSQIDEGTEITIFIQEEKRR